MKIWTRKEVDQLLSNSDTAVERAMVRLFEADAFHERDAEAGTHFAQWVSGMNGRNKVVYPPKSLDHNRSLRRFRKLCLRGELPIDRARRIALLHSQFLTDVANRHDDQEPEYVQVPLPFNDLDEQASAESSNLDDISRIADEFDRSLDDDTDTMEEDLDSIDVSEPEQWTWADTARLMAKGDDSGFDWDAWKDEMKERDME